VPYAAPSNVSQRPKGLTGFVQNATMAPPCVLFTYAGLEKMSHLALDRQLV